MFRQFGKRVLSALCPATTWSIIAASQNNDRESKSLVRLAEMIDCHPTFVEFGFHPYQYNSVGLTKLQFDGLLMDGDPKNCELANRIFKRLGLKARARPQWITLTSLDPIYDFVRHNGGQLGVLNVDIDGNDYWILQELLKHIEPEIICVEHNASLGTKPITVPYDDGFMRYKHHDSGWYHGASISAFDRLLADEYALVENIVGLNLVFVRRDRLPPGLKALDAKTAYEECEPRNKWSSSRADEQWEAIKELAFISV